jgi:hypothetical protein
MLTQTTVRENNRWVGGAILIALGTLLLAGQLFRGDWIGQFILLVLGGIFLLAGITNQNYGLLVPGSILSGLGVGVLLEKSLPFLSSDARGSIVVLALAAGFVIIMPLGAVFARTVRVWPLVVGGLLGFIGTVSFVGSILNIPNIGDRLWPLILVALGVYLILRRR